MANQEDHAIYERLKHVVVQIMTLEKEKPCTEDTEIVVENVGEGTGFIVTPTGHIMTAAHVIRDPAAHLFYCRRVINDNQNLLEVEVVELNRQRDMAILAVKSAVDWPVVEFSKELIEAGMKVFCIGHPQGFPYSCMVGHVAFPSNDVAYSTMTYVKRDSLHYAPESRACRHLGEIRREGQNYDDLDADLPVIQINNIHGSFGSSGSAVFDSNGGVIGMMILHDLYNWAIDRVELQHYLRVSNLLSWWAPGQPGAAGRE